MNQSMKNKVLKTYLTLLYEFYVHMNVALIRVRYVSVIRPMTLFRSNVDPKPNPSGNESGSEPHRGTTLYGGIYLRSTKENPQHLLFGNKYSSSSPVVLGNTDTPVFAFCIL